MLCLQNDNEEQCTYTVQLGMSIAFDFPNPFDTDSQGLSSIQMKWLINDIYLRTDERQLTF